MTKEPKNAGNTAKTASKAVATPKNTQVADAADFEYGGGGGFENMTSDDIVIPTLLVLQALSPQVAKPVGDGGVEGARPGMLFHTITGELIDGREGIGYVPISVDTEFVEWVPREKGGGIVARYRPDDPYVAEVRKFNAGKAFGKLETKDGNELIETKNLYGALLRDGEPAEPCVIRFTSSKIKKLKNLLMALKLFSIKLPSGARIGSDKIPLWAHRLLIKTVGEKSKKGDFYNFELEPFNGDHKSSIFKAQDPWIAQGRDYHDNLFGANMAKIKVAGDDVDGDDEGEAIPF